MSDFWNQKYSTKEYLYGIDPNPFIKEQLIPITPGKILFPAEGEGRNAVFAAGLGWDVWAFDPSSVAQQKAIKLARKAGVSIKYSLEGYEEVTFSENTFDAIGLSFTHMPPDLRQHMHRKYISWLKPGGILIMEAFSKEQMQYQSGGPRDIHMLFSKAELQEDFQSLSTLDISVELTQLNEGSGHQGTASVIHMTGEK